jgi:hypothetical protein
MGVSPMNDRTAARAVGIFFIVATLAGVVAGLLQSPVLDADDLLTEVATENSMFVAGVLLEMVMGIAVVGIIVSIVPILRRFGPRLTLGFTIARSIEAVFYGVSVVCGLTLVAIGEEAAGTATGDTLQAVVLGARDWGNLTVQAIAFAIGALLMNWLLVRTSLVPRWLAGWGVVGAIIYLFVGPAVAYGLEPSSTGQMLLVLPLAVQEMVFAIWLIVKGFTPVEATA